jgi:hypothetical protein
MTSDRDPWETRGFRRKVRRRLEDEVLRDLAGPRGHLSMRGTKGIVFWHHPGGGVRSKVEAAIMQGLGTKAGLPDLFVLHKGQLFGLELKHGKAGRLSKAQKQMLAELETAGAIVGVAVGLDEALEWLTKHGLLRGALQ